MGLTSVGSFNCLGSVSGSFGNGFISIGGGTTTESVECNRRANAVMAPGGAEGPVGQALLVELNHTEEIAVVGHRQSSRAFVMG